LYDFSVHLIILQSNDNFFLLLTGLVADAMNKYTEALTASDFSKASGNLDVLVIPVLCNLAACCIQIGDLVFKSLFRTITVTFVSPNRTFFTSATTEEYGKGVRFCDQALALKPDCGKAHMRRGERS
jgi:hypothetical protein